jgi:hypothetical protein
MWPETIALEKMYFSAAAFKLLPLTVLYIVQHPGKDVAAVETSWWAPFRSIPFEVALARKGGGGRGKEI